MGKFVTVVVNADNVESTYRMALTTALHEMAPQVTDGGAALYRKAHSKLVNGLRAWRFIFEVSR